MKRSFNQYTDSELLQLDSETITDAIRIEAIERGVKPPINFSEALRKSEWVGYKLPGEYVPVYQVCAATDSYGSPTATPIAYLSEEQAIRSLEGVVIVDENRYGKSGPRIVTTGRLSIQKAFIGYSSSEEKAAKLEVICEDGAKEFETIQDECLARLSRVRQADYDARVNAEKKTEYLRLAGGNEEIAKGFWAKVERSAWPE